MPLRHAQLMLARTGVVDVSPLAAVPSLAHVDLSTTSVTDVTPFAARSAARDDCPALDVRGAPLDAASIEQAIPKLCADGWKVMWGARWISCPSCLGA